MQVSEGLDFADRAGRAVIVTGMPFATPTDAKVCFYLYDVYCLPSFITKVNNVSFCYAPVLALELTILYQIY